MIESLLLVSSVCIDAFLASIAYGTNKIKIPLPSAIIISAVGSLILGFSLFMGSLVKELLPSFLPCILSFCILMFLGIYRLFEGLFKSYIQKKERLDKPLKFKAFDMNFVIQVYADETKADFDKSKILSTKEAFYLAFALSFDSLAVGFGSSLGGGNYLLTIALCFFIGLLCVLLGTFLGKKITENSNLNLSWLSGVILMVLAVNKLF